MREYRMSFRSAATPLCVGLFGSNMKISTVSWSLARWWRVRIVRRHQGQNAMGTWERPQRRKG